MDAKKEFFERKFMYNNLRILFFSIFLTLEQTYYGLFVRTPGSFLQRVHFFSAIIMFIYAIVSVHIQTKPPERISWIHKTYEIGFGFYGFLIAVIRSLFISDNLFQLPTVYIAVIYGFAVIFYFQPIKSLFIYGVSSIILILALPVFQPVVLNNSYIQDILSNNMIAWIASILNYRKYRREFINEKTINKNNQTLKEKTLQIEKMNVKLKNISIRDGLTNIFNRRKLDQILEYEYNRAIQYQKELSVIFVDVDLFKSVNDTYGHNVGDKVLIEIAEILKNNIGETDILGRWGGEEFLVVCPETDMHQAAFMSEKLRKAVAKNSFSVIDQKTCSFGVATYKEGDTVKDLIQRADEGLYRAKAKGRNRVEVIK